MSNRDSIRGGKTPTESFYEDMVVDTFEAAARLEDLIESDVRWKRGDTVFSYGVVDDEFIRRMTETYGRRK